MKASRLWLGVAIVVCCIGCGEDTTHQTVRIEDDRPCADCELDACNCDDGTDCPEGEKEKCSSAPACTCDDGSDCPDGDRNKCSSAPACTCDDGTDCPDGDQNKCSSAPACNCDDGSACPDGDQNKCSSAPACTCDDGTDCPDGDQNKCSSAPAPCTAEKPDNAVSCECLDGKWANCTYPQPEPCSEICNAQNPTKCSPGGVLTCSPDANGCAVWTLTKPCQANQICDETQQACIDACNPACGSGQICDKGKCVCDPALPEGWPASLSPLSYPVMIPTKSKSMRGSDNIYAPDIHEVSGVRVMWYGAQGGDGHDRIFVAWSKDGAEWRKYPSDADPKPVLDRGSSNHVNDPSLVHVNNVWKMYYTDAPTDINDRIWLAESNSLTGFRKVQEVLGPGPAGAWDSEKVGRPAVLYENGIYKMWYDGAANGHRHVGLATSTDGIHFTRHPNNPLFLNAGAIDVDKIGGVYVMLHEGQKGTNWATSVDGVCWVDRGQLFGLSGASYDKFGQVTPFLEVAGGKLRAVWFGGASVVSWNRNRIGAAYAPGTAPSGGGCTACTTTGQTCAEACQSVGAGNTGSCGSPNSTTPGACCACANDGCEKCVVGAKDCHQACVNIGRAGGYCAHPGSSESSKCCACLD